MKKIALLTTVLMVLGLTSLSAQMVDEASGVTFEIDGEASLIFGIDLDVSGEIGTGFDANVATSSISITLVAESSSSKVGDSGAYGHIELEDFELGLDEDGVTGAEPSVSAEIVSGPLTIGIYSAPGISVDKVSVISSEVATAYDSSGGITIGFSQDPIDLSIELVSEASYDANTTKAYALEVNTGIGVDPIDIDVAFAVGSGYASNPIGVGVNTGIDLGAAAAYLALDLQSDADTTSYEIGTGVGVGLGGDASLNVDVEYGNTGTVDARVAFEDGGSEVAVPGLDNLELFAAFQIVDVTEVVAMSWEFELSGTYTKGDIAPYAGFGVDSANLIDVTAGVGLSLIANTAFDLKWTTPDVSTDNGVITFETTISY